jgi:hypothetical protein
VEFLGAVLLQIFVLFVFANVAKLMVTPRVPTGIKRKAIYHIWLIVFR